MIDELIMEFRRIELAVYKAETRQDERFLMEDLRNLHKRVLEAIDLSAEKTSEESGRQMIRLIALADSICSFEDCMSYDVGGRP